MIVVVLFMLACLMLCVALGAGFPISWGLCCRDGVFFIYLFLLEHPPANWPMLVCEEGTAAFVVEELPTSSRKSLSCSAFTRSRLIFCSSSGLGLEMRSSASFTVSQLLIVFDFTEWHVSKIEKALFIDQSYES